jgi:PadR family transcriptional regulator PadR
VETGSLYPALHRLEKRGWVAADWGTTDNKQRAKIYRLTAAGRKQLSAEQSRWSQFVDAMAALMRPRDREA